MTATKIRFSALSVFVLPDAKRFLLTGQKYLLYFCHLPGTVPGRSFERTGQMTHYYFIRTEDPGLYNRIAYLVSRMEDIQKAQFNPGKKAVRFKSENLFKLSDLCHFAKHHVKQT